MAGLISATISSPCKISHNFFRDSQSTRQRPEQNVPKHRLKRMSDRVEKAATGCRKWGRFDAGRITRGMYGASQMFFVPTYLFHTTITPGSDTWIRKIPISSKANNQASCETNNHTWRKELGKCKPFMVSAHPETPKPTVYRTIEMWGLDQSKSAQFIAK